MKVVCFQPDIRAYRVPFFCALNDAVGGGLVVVHFGNYERADEANFDVVKIERRFSTVVPRLKEMIRYSRESAVCIAVFDVRYWDVFCAVFSAPKGARRVFWGHGLGRSLFGRVVRTVAAKVVDGVIVYGREGRRQLLQAGIPSEKVFVAPNTMWVMGHRNTSESEKSYFLFVGRIQPRKRLDLLVDAYADYSRQLGNEALGLAVVGDGEDEKLLKERCGSVFGQSEIQWVAGTTDERRLAEFFSGAIAYVSPGHVGLGVLHAFAFGVPVVTCDMDGHAPEFENIINHRNGLIVSDNVNALASAMVRLTKDRDMSRRLGDAAYETYQSTASPKAMLQGFMSALGRYAI